MENQKKSKGTTVLIVLLLLITIVAVAIASYAWAKYTSSTSGNAVANIAKWNVTFNTSDELVVSQQSHVVTGKIAPGSKGTFSVAPVPNDTEVCFNYTITITDAYLVDSTGTKVTSISGLPSGTSLSDFYSHLIVKNNGTTLTIGGANPTEVTGTYNLGSHNSTTGAALDGTSTFDWEWKFSDTNDANYDAIDTAVGQAVAAGTVQGLKFDYTITAVQVDPQNANH